MKKQVDTNASKFEKLYKDQLQSNQVLKAKIKQLEKDLKLLQEVMKKVTT